MTISSYYAPFLFSTSTLALLAGFALAGQSDDAKFDTRPRGVPPQFASFYQQAKEFTCLDGLKKLPFEQVNDDYCDCADGSDEPGTSACRNAKFYCPNLGYRPAMVPSSRVNDFICDCCDGSDEWDSGVECPNICEAQGSQAREDAKREQEVREAGWTRRKELAKEGQNQLEERRAELERKRKELEEVEAIKEEAERKKKEAEAAEDEAKRRQDEQFEAERRRKDEAESVEMMRKMDADGDGRLTQAELKQYSGLVGEEDGPPEAVLKDVFGTDEAKIDALDLEGLVGKLTMVRDFLGKVQERMEAKKEEEKPDEGNETEQEQEQQENNVKEEEEEEEKVPTEEPVAESSPYNQETRQLIERADEARKEFNEADRRLGQLQEEIRESEQFLDSEYGPDHAWAPLKGKCAELTNSQYTYKICLFDKTVQKDRGGYSEVNLGYWGSWSGPDTDKFTSQLYDKGQSCWNGPERSTHVELACGTELELVDASEPNKCEYKFVVKVPTACRSPEEMKADHSEL